MARIVFLSTSGIDNASPRGRWLPMARALARDGHQMQLILLHPVFDQLTAAQRDCERDGVRIRHVAQMHVYGEAGAGGPGARRRFSAGRLLRVSARATLALARAAIEARPDVIHICKPQPMNSAAALIARARTGCQLYLDCDDYEAGANRFDADWQRALVRLVEDAMPRRVRGVTANTQFLRARAQSLGARRIALVPNGVDAAFMPLRRAHNGRSVVYIGHMSMVSHSVDLLLSAFAKVLQAMPDARLRMAGAGDDLPALRQLGDKLGIAHAIEWLGPLSAGAIPALYATATCTVDPVRDAPALRARSPLKIVESLAAGVPVATGDVGDRRAMLAGYPPDLLARPDDPADLARVILALLRDPFLNRDIAAISLSRSARYRIETLAHDWAEIYESRK